MVLNIYRLILCHFCVLMFLFSVQTHFTHCSADTEQQRHSWMIALQTQMNLILSIYQERFVNME